ncbi:MAG: DegV family protein [Bacilli bacterium]|jgi:DegV family protein with EDD domain|nr:DegV family protein [Bacilli bacterium]
MKYKYKIVVDSSSNLLPGFIDDPEVGFEVVPLKIRIDGKDFTDNKDGDVKEMLAAFHAAKWRPFTSCPSPQDYIDAYQDAENVIAVTISSKMSGSFNSAYVASVGLEGVKVHVVDSKATSGNMILIVEKAYALIKEGKSFEEIENEIEAYAESLKLFFLLDSFETLQKAGRINPIVAFIAGAVGIKAICQADERGEIKLFKKAHTMKKALLTLAADLGEVITKPEEKTCIISFVEDDTIAKKLKENIAALYHFKEIRLVPDRLLCSFYSLEGGIIVSF